MTLVTAACVGMAVPDTAVSQSAAHDFIRGNWNSFLEHCNSLVENPGAVKEALAITQNTVEFAQSEDGAAVSYAENFQSGNLTKAFVIEVFSSRIDGHCTVEHYSRDQSISSQSLAAAMTEMMDATKALSYKGGRTLDVMAQRPNSGYAYYVDGLFPNRAAYLYVGFDDDYFSLEVHVDYPISGWSQ